MKIENLKFNFWLWKFRVKLRLKEVFYVSDETWLCLYFGFPLMVAVGFLGLIGYIIGVGMR